MSNFTIPIPKVSRYINIKVDETHKPSEIAVGMAGEFITLLSLRLIFFVDSLHLSLLMLGQSPPS